MALAEIARLEGVFSLHHRDSALARRNAVGRLEAPPFELLERLSLCSAVHTASGGAFDPTAQHLWRLHAEIAATLPRIGWVGALVDAQAITFARTGMALTLNGIAQGVIADRVADLLAAEGLTDILVNTGEFRALGGHPDAPPCRYASTMPRPPPWPCGNGRWHAPAPSAPPSTPRATPATSSTPAPAGPPPPAGASSA